MKVRLCSLATAFVGTLGWAVLSAAPPHPETVEAPCHAGKAHEVSRWAIRSDTSHYIGYLVGGGCAKFRRGEGPSTDEGTWGWDYRGWIIPRRVNLLWWHGRYQGGTGAYKTDGPHFHASEEEHHENSHQENDH